jgi:hypothetical protein
VLVSVLRAVASIIPPAFGENRECRIDWPERAWLPRREVRRE